MIKCITFIQKTNGDEGQMKREKKSSKSAHHFPFQRTLPRLLIKLKLNLAGLFKFDVLTVGSGLLVLLILIH